MCGNYLQFCEIYLFEQDMHQLRKKDLIKLRIECSDRDEKYVLIYNKILNDVGKTILFENQTVFKVILLKSYQGFLE